MSKIKKRYWILSKKKNKHCTCGGMENLIIPCPLGFGLLEENGSLLVK